MSTEPGRKWLSSGALSVMLAALCAASATAQMSPDEQGRLPVEIIPLQASKAKSGRLADEHRLTQGFWVESRASELNLSCVVSDMQIDRDKQHSSEAILGAREDHGCRIEVPGAVSTLGMEPARVAGFDAVVGDGNNRELSSHYVTFRTVDGSAFEREVYVSIIWKHTRSKQLSGRYKGAIKLVATIPGEFEEPR